MFRIALSLFFVFLSIVNLHGQKPQNLKDANGKQGLWRVTDIDPDFDYVLITYKNNIKHGPFWAFYEGDTLALEGYFHLDQLHGEHNVYYKSSCLQTKSRYENGLEHGIRFTYYESGPLYKREEYKKGKLNGAYEVFYESGILHYTYRASNDLGNGPYTMYHENGKPALQGEMKEDKKIGVWYKFSPSGDTLKIMTY